MEEFIQGDTIHIESYNLQQIDLKGFFSHILHGFSQKTKYFVLKSNAQTSHVLQKTKHLKINTCRIILFEKTLITKRNNFSYS